jgi:hypothetical protein
MMTSSPSGVWCVWGKGRCEMRFVVWGKGRCVVKGKVRCEMRCVVGWVV